MELSRVGFKPHISKIWVRRPIIWMLITLAAGIVLSSIIEVKLLIPFLIMVLVFISAIIMPRYAFPFALVLLFIFGLIHGETASNRINPLKSYSGKEVIIKGKVVGIPQYTDEKDVYVIELMDIEDKVSERSFKASQTNGALSGNSSLAGNKASNVYKSCRIRLSVYPRDKEELDQVFKPGDIIRAAGKIKEPDGQRNPKGFNYKAYLNRQGISNIMSTGSYDIVLLKEGSKFSFNRIISSIRDRSVEFINQAVGGEEANLLNGMLLGTRWLISDETGDSFAETGLSHILAISGLNVGFIILLVVKLTSLLRLKKAATFIIQALIMTAFCILVGASPSVVRAVLMAAVYLGGKALDRRSDVLNSAGFAAFLMLLFKPLDIFDVGFQLSFVTVCSIALLYDPIKGHLSKLNFLPSWAVSTISVTVAAQIGALPITIYNFNSISFISLIANLIAVPLSGFLVITGFILLTLGLILPFDIVFLGFILKLPCLVLIKSSAFMAKLPFASINMISPPIAIIAVYFTLLWILSPERPRFIKRPVKSAYVIACVTTIVTMLVILLLPVPLKLVFLDVGQGDCIYIRTPDRKHILIDSGGNIFNPDESQTGEDVILPFLLKHGVAELDLVIVSHGHDDHIGGMPYILDEIDVDAIMLAPPLEETENYRKMIDLVHQKHIKIIKPYEGQSCSIDTDVDLKVLYPVSDKSLLDSLTEDNENNRSLVIKLDYNGADALFTGDIESIVENYLAPMITEDIDILKVPHHGSKTSSTQTFIDAVNPKAAIIQVGQNFYGHPNPEVLERYESGSIPVYRNDLNGAVVCIYKKGKWEISTMLNESLHNSEIS